MNKTNPNPEHDYKIVFLTDAEAELADKVLTENKIFHSPVKEDHTRDLKTTLMAMVDTFKTKDLSIHEKSILNAADLLNEKVKI